jgi:hypothetical protein
MLVSAGAMAPAIDRADDAPDTNRAILRHFHFGHLRRRLPFRRAQSLVKGFCSEVLAGFAPTVRVMSMRARNAAGTCRCPG